jgi:putative transposase
MARQARIDVPGTPQHLIVRGHNRSPLFADDQDRCVYMRQLDKALRESNCELHAYVLMTNHVHLLATGRDRGGISSAMHRVGTHFAKWVNLRRETTGSVFEGRFKSFPVDGATYFLTCMRYIELNPVRAGLASRPGGHSWSSYSANASGAPNGILIPHQVYLGLGEDGRERGRTYVSLFDRPILDVQLAAIRACARRGRPYGDTEFVARFEASPVMPNDTGA